MGTFTCQIEVFSPDGDRSTTIEALEETRVCFTCLPSSLLHDLGIVPHRQVQSELPDGSVVDDEIGEGWVRLAGVETNTIVLFDDNTAPPRLGHLTLTGAMLTVDTDGSRLVPAWFRHVSHPVLVTGGNSA